jgi:hypothetical protein
MSTNKLGQTMKPQICPHCGHKIAEYKHGLNKPGIQALCTLHEFGGTANIANIGLTHNKICNFATKKLWGLIHPLGDGIWEITPRGIAFLSGDEAIPRFVITLNGKFVRFEGELVTIKTYLPDGYLHRSDYAIQNRTISADETISLFGGAS